MEIHVPSDKWIRDKKKNSKHFCEGFSIICYEKDNKMIFLDLLENDETEIPHCYICGKRLKSG